MPKTSAARLATSARYDARHPRIVLRATPEEAGRIKAAASAAGQSVQRYILDAVRARMDWEAQRGE